MLKELKGYYNLGTPKYFWELIKLLKNKDVWQVSHVNSHFYNKIIDGKQIFDGCLPLLKICGIISIDTETDEVVLSYAFKGFNSKQNLKLKLLTAFLNKLNSDEEFHNIFKSSVYDYEHHNTIIIDRSAFSFKYANIMRLLIAFEFLKPHPFFEKKLLISYEWKDFFNINVSPKVKKVMSIELLKKKLKQQELNGEEAEKFVLDFENRRLNKKDGIQWIASYDVGAGYDILSFHHADDQKLNRFIEVKSYSGERPYFYWSKNERQVAEEKKMNYMLYLINRDKVYQNGYEPEIITDPVRNILESDAWTKTIETYHLIK